jgi:hypothetical protein
VTALTEAAPPKKQFDEASGPVVWCEECRRERVQFDFTKSLQLCVDCQSKEA